MTILRGCMATLMLGMWVESVDAGMDWEHIAHAIDLTSDQLHDLQAAEADMLHEIRRIEAAFQEHRVNREEAHAQVGAARQAFEEAWQAIVTEEQKQRWREVREHRAGRKRQESDGLSDRVHDQVLLSHRFGEVVNLSSEQIDQIDEAQAAFVRRLRRIRNAVADGGLTDEAAREHTQGALTELNRSLVRILNEHQLERIRESRIYDGDLSVDGQDESPPVPEADPGLTSIAATSWGQLKQERNP